MWRITKRNRGVSFARVLAELRTFTDGWVGYFWRARTPSVFQALDEWVRRRLRCYQWKQWRTPQRRAQALRAVTSPGTRPRTGGGPWRAAGSPQAKAALSNATLRSLGFHSLLDRYHALAAA